MGWALIMSDNSWILFLNEEILHFIIRLCFTDIILTNVSLNSRKKHKI